MKPARIARRNRLPDSIPVVLELLEGHPFGVTIACLEEEIKARKLWDLGECLTARALYFRIYSVLGLLKSHGIVRTTPSQGRGDLWVLDPAAAERRRRLELSELIQPFVDGCLVVTTARRFVEHLNDLIEDGTIDAMVQERRAQGRRKK